MQLFRKWERLGDFSGGGALVQRHVRILNVDVSTTMNKRLTGSDRLHEHKTSATQSLNGDAENARHENARNENARHENAATKYET